MSFNDFIGQRHIIEDLVINIASSLDNGQSLEHSMFYGPPGLGKTTLAELVASEMMTRVWQQTGQELKKDYLLDLYSEIGIQDILFIDEIHSVDTKTYEILYGPMQIINNLKLDNDMPEEFLWEGRYISPFTVIGATTSAGMITKPMRDRIILSYNFNPYNNKEISQILMNKNCPKESAEFIAKRSRGVPRMALNYFLRIRNQAIEASKITLQACADVFARIGVNNEGFIPSDLDVLSLLLENGPTSESEIYRSLGIDKEDYRNIHEPFLLQNKMIEITSKGRVLNKNGITYIKGVV